MTNTITVEVPIPMALLESITVIDGNGIALMLPGDLAFASAKEVER